MQWGRVQAWKGYKQEKWFMHCIGVLPFRAPLTGRHISNHLTFKAKCQVLHPGRNNFMHQYGFSTKWMESRFSEKDLEILVDKLDTSMHHGQFWAHKHKRNKGTLKQVQQRHTKMIKGLEHLPDKERLSEFRLLHLEERNQELGNEQGTKTKVDRLLPVTSRNRTKRH